MVPIQICLCFNLTSFTGCVLIDFSFDVQAYIKTHGFPQAQSGQQEKYEGIMNRYV